MAHLLRAQSRFGNRMGNQSAGAVSYFSILAIVPLLMFAFSLLGATLTILRPDWLELVKGEITEAISKNFNIGSDLTDKINELIDSYLSNWRGVGIIGVVSLAYAGSGWLGNLRTAIRAQWRPELENEVDRRNWAITLITNLWMLLVLLVAVGITFAVGTVGTALSTYIAHWLHLEDYQVGRITIKLATVLISAIAACGMFLLIFWLLPRTRAPRGALIKGSLTAGILLAVLQLGAGLLFGVLGRNKAVVLFGPIIVLMLLFNLFGRLILMVAAWIGTATQPAVAYRYNAADEPLRHDPRAETAPGHWRRADRERLRQLTKELDLEVSTVTAPTAPLLRRAAPRRIDFSRPDANQTVPHDVAVRTIKAGTAAGYAVGTATGLGLGAAIVAGLARLGRR